MRASVRFVRRGHVVERTNFPPTALLLDYLRNEEGVTSVKEACRTGDCGACTVAVGRRKAGRLHYEPVNACLQPIGALDACEVVTVDDIAAKDGDLHPIQAALRDAHAAQCGFCLPGTVMNLFALYHQTAGAVSRGTVTDWLAGNLCRCTGYRPIVDAALAATVAERADLHAAAAEDTAALLGFLDDREDIFVGTDDAFFSAPRRIEAFGELLEVHQPDVQVLAGGTELASTALPTAARVISADRIAELHRIEDTGREILVGSAAPLADLETVLRSIDPDIGELLRRFGGSQIRARASLGGNIAGAWPTPDLVPALLALGARIELRRGRRGRWLQLDEFYLADGQRHIAPGEFLATVAIPKLAPTQLFRAFKVSRRFDADTAVVTGAFRFTIANSTIFEARVAFVGLSRAPRRAAAAEAALKGTRVGDTSAWRQAFDALQIDFAPSGDVRGSARYRADMAQALLGKALIETAGTDSERTRLVGIREVAGHAGA
ncbi:MAG: FAD binding domain-containing protein [Bauldia sp.]